MPQLYPYTGNQVNIVGVVIVYYFGRAIAIVDSDGVVMWRDEYYPLFLVEYLLTVPDRLTDIRRN